MSRIVVAMLVSATAVSPAVADPDPVALLRGVRAAREGLSGRLTATVEVKNIRPPRGDGKTELDIAFDASRRRVVSAERAVIHKPDRTPAAAEQAKRMMPDEVVASGQGQWEPIRDRVIVDGNRVRHFMDQMYSAKYATFARGTYGRFNDPRLLGLAVEPGISKSVADCLGDEAAKSVSLAGSEVVAGQTVWKVAVTRDAGVTRTFWAEDTEGFRVHRYEDRADRKD